MSFDFDKLLADYDKKVEELNAAKKKMQEELAKQMEPLFVEFFKNNPKIGQIAWTQYTPYFNDGEPCVFNVHEHHFVPTKFIEEDEDYDYQEAPSLWSSVGFSDYEAKEFKEAGLTEEEIARVEAFGKFLNKIPEDIYEGVYGDHAEIVATINGVTVEEYSHD